MGHRARRRWATGLRRAAATLVRGLRLPLVDQLLSARCLVELAVIEVSLRLVSLPRATRLLGVDLQLSHDVAEGLDARVRAQLPAGAWRRARAARRVARRWPFAAGPCLRQSLVLCRLLAPWQPVLRLGLYRPDDGSALVAHAWVEMDGVALEDTRGLLPFDAPAGTPSAGARRQAP